MPDLCPKTEDFLTFLCLRGTPLLSESLNVFNTPFCPSALDPVPNPNPNHSSNLQTKQNHSGNLQTKQIHFGNSQTKPNHSGNSQTKPEQSHAIETRAVNVIVTSKMQTKIHNGNISAKVSMHLISKKKLGLGRIHSNFHKRIGSAKILTRLRCLRSDATNKSQKTVPSKQIAPKSKKLPNRPDTRSQRSSHPIQESSSSSSSSSDESSESESSPEPTAVKYTRASKSKAVVGKPVAKKREEGKESLRKTADKRTSIVAKNTRQSTSRLSTPNSSPAKHRSLKGTSAVNLPAASRRSAALVTKSSVSSRKHEPNKTITREVARKLRQEIINSINSPRAKVSTAKSSDSPSGRRRPSRRTKEAATLNMTLIGHEERGSSSELEDPEEQPQKPDKKPKEPERSTKSNNKHLPVTNKKINIFYI